MDCITTARNYTTAGLSVLPIASDGSKAPETRRLPRDEKGKATWTPYQEQIVEGSELARLFAVNGRPVGIGIIGGKVSGNLEVLDIDEPALVEPFEQAVEELAPGLLARIPAVRTPREGCGRHYYYRTAEPPPGNLKLAQSEPRPQFDKQTGEPVIDPRTGKQRHAPDTLAETHGTNGYVVAPGSPAACHPTGREYQHVAGPALTAIPTITSEERDVLLSVARSFHRHVEDLPHATAGTSTTSGLSPGDDFADKTTWQEIIGPAGWTMVSNRGGVTSWRRPGKSSGSISATTGLRSKSGAELLCVFSSNAHPFELPSGRTVGTYSKFAAYAILNHGGDFQAAAKRSPPKDSASRRGGSGRPRRPSPTIRARSSR